MTSETDEAKAHWASLSPARYYEQEGIQSFGILWCIEALRKRAPIRSAFEFGCNVGRNLHVLRRSLGDDARLKGIDINERAIARGRELFGLDLDVADETTLSRMKDDEFDVCYTLSVLDHITPRPTIAHTIQHLARVAKYYVVMLEPFNGRDERSALEIAAKYNYFWNYPAICRENDLFVRDTLPWPLGAGEIRGSYTLFVVTKNAAMPGLASFDRLKLRWRHLMARSS